MDDFFAGLGAFFIIAFIVIGAILGLSAIRFNPEQGGAENGYVVAVDKEGIFFPNYHIFLKNDTAQTEAVSYCVNQTNTKIADQLKAYARSKQQVEIEYVGVRGFGWQLCGYEEITSVRPI